MEARINFKKTASFLIWTCQVVVTLLCLCTGNKAQECIVAQSADSNDGLLTTMECTNCSPPRTVPICYSRGIGCAWKGIEPCC
jgi:hypothetical protein